MSEKVKSQHPDAKRQFDRRGRRTGLAIVILAAVLLEAMAAVQYYYTRGILERSLEKQVLLMLRSAAMRLDGHLNAVADQASSQVWHAQQHIDDPGYMETMVKNLVKSGGHSVLGVGVGFIPYYYPEKGRWYEPYARRTGDSVEVEQIGSELHDYLELGFYKSSIKGDTLHWTTPYMDNMGAKNMVVTYSLPLRDSRGCPVAALGIDVATDWISESLRKISLYPSSFCLVLTEEGDVVAAPDDSICSRELVDTIASQMINPAVKKVEKANGVTSFEFYDKAKGRSGRVYYARKVNAPKWMMVKGVYDDEAFGELAQLQRNILWLTIAGVLVLGLIIMLFAHNGRKLHDTLLQQQRTNNELQIANGIQQALLPLDEPLLRDDARVQVEGRLIPAREVGGDLYNMFVCDGKLFFCIGDVSGKGVPAALIMAVTQTLFHNVAAEESNPARIMERMNVTACRNNEAGMFVTLFIGVLDLSTGHLDYCNGGHERPLLTDGARWSVLQCTPNMPIGLFDDFAYEMQQTTIAPGATLFLYTDGLTEARNARNELLGRNRVMQLMDSCNGLAPKAMVDRVVAGIKQYAGQVEPSDDLTLLAIKFNA